MLAAGKLSHRIELQAPTESLGGQFNDVQTAWATQATVWAAKEPLSGRELLQAQQVQSEISVRFRIRHRADVTAKWRVLHAGRVYPIVAPPVDVGGQGVELQLLCTEVRVG